MSFTDNRSFNNSGRTFAPNIIIDRRSLSDDELVRGMARGRNCFDRTSSAEMGPPTQPEGDCPLTLVDKFKTLSLYDTEHLDQIHPEDPKDTKPVVEVVKDGHYFHNIVTMEQCRLMQMVVKVEGFTNESSSECRYSEEALEKMRIFSGSTRLLSTSKMKQFVDLCQKNINPVPDDPFKVTADDLEGFWDMVYQQVPPLNVLYEDILKIHASKTRATGAPGPGQR